MAMPAMLVKPGDFLVKVSQSQLDAPMSQADPTMVAVGRALDKVLATPVHRRCDVLFDMFLRRPLVAAKVRIELKRIAQRAKRDAYLAKCREIRRKVLVAADIRGGGASGGCSCTTRGCGASGDCTRGGGDSSACTRGGGEVASGSSSRLAALGLKRVPGFQSMRSDGSLSDTPRPAKRPYHLLHRDDADDEGGDSCTYDFESDDEAELLRKPADAGGPSRMLCNPRMRGLTSRMWGVTSNGSELMYQVVPPPQEQVVHPRRRCPRTNSVLLLLHP